MQVSSTNTVTGNSGTTERKTTSNLGKDDFLKLMVTQLKYQDPMNPMEDKDSIAQMAQFTSLEQMQNLNKSMELQTASAMIGKAIKAEVNNDDGGTELVYGYVISARQNSGQMYITLDNGKQVNIADVEGILNTGGLYQEALTLVDRNVYMRKYDSTGIMNGYKMVTIKTVTVNEETGAVQLIATNGDTYGMKDIWNIAPDTGTL